MVCSPPQVLLEFLSKVVSRERRNRMNLWAVSTIMAPNLFLHKTVPSRLDGAEKGQAERAADIMRLLIRYQDLLWTVSSQSLTHAASAHTCFGYVYGVLGRCLYPKHWIKNKKVRG